MLISPGRSWKENKYKKIISRYRINFNCLTTGAGIYDFEFTNTVKKTGYQKFKIFK